MISQELAIMIAGQKAKELSAICKKMPQETDFSSRAENHARKDAYRKLHHILLTGDKALRNAAAEESVRFIGTLGILDQLKETNAVTLEEYRYCIEQLLQHNGKDVRLPEAELRLRLKI